MSMLRTSPSLGLFNLPNTLTTARLFLAFVIFAVIALRQWEAALLLFGLAALTDWLDGHIARRQGSESPLGRIYDPLVDKILIVGIFVFFLDVRDSGLEGNAGWNPVMVVVLVAREFLVTGIRNLLEERGASFGADRLGKAKMIVQCTAIVWIFAAFSFARSSPSPFWVAVVRDMLNWSTVTITAASGVQYAIAARKHFG